MEAAGPSDSCLTQDEESSCDTMGPQPNGHVPSTEEESSNEPPDAAQNEPLDSSEVRKQSASKEEEEPIAKEVVSADGEKPNQLHCHGDSSQTMADGDNQDKQTELQPLMEMSESSDAEARPKHTEGLLVSQVDCVNGNESMDSVDSHSPKRSNEAESMTEGSNNNSEQDEHKDKNKSEPTQEHLPQDGREVTENVEDDQDQEGIELLFLIHLRKTF